jgi:hypothetical protein
MKRFFHRVPFLFLTIFLLQPLFGEVPAAEKIFYGFEMNGTLIGYVEVTIAEPAEAGDPRPMTSVLFAKMTLLGQDFDLRVDETYELDAESGAVLRHRSETVMGTMNIETSVEVKGDEAHVVTTSGGEPKIVPLDDDVILEDSIQLKHILGEVTEVGASKLFRVFDYNAGEIRNVRYERNANSTFSLEGTQHPCGVFKVTEKSLGFSGKVWLDLEDGRVMYVTLPNSVVIYRTSPAVVGKIKRAELNDILLAPVDVGIADFQGITYMKVKAQLRTVGEEVTVESLNVPGQTFTGSVEENFVDGVFEISIPRYDGDDAPSFPPDLGGDSELLEPEPLIEAKDPVLREFAEELTAGSADSWEAAKRLSQWVADEITYEIPGGSARSTFDARKGECGSHSRLLVAFCRSVGIPARLATGCMYAPNYGGTFGQHAWTEIYMGEAGWIPVDSTAHEIDFVDSGHIRLGSLASFQPEKMEILDHRVRSLEGAKEARLGAFLNMPWKTGERYSYSYTANGAPLGTDSFTIESQVDDDGDSVITCRTETALTGLEVKGSFQLDGQGHPISFHVAGKTAQFEYTVDCEFTDGKVIEKVVRAGQETERTIDLPDEVFLVDNNQFAGYALLLAATPLEEGTVVTFKVFHPSSMQVLPVQITVGGMEVIEREGEKTNCRRCDLVIAGTPLQLWLDDEGRIVRESEGGGKLVLDLMK